MAQAFDEGGNELGPEVFGESMKEVFDKIQDEHKNPTEIRLRKLQESVSELATKYDEDAKDIVSRIDLRMGAGWCAELATALTQDEPDTDKK